MASGGQTNDVVADFRKHLLADMSNCKKEALAAHTQPALPTPSDIGHLTVPGGFRRDFLHKQADIDGIPMENRPQAWKRSLMQSVRPLVRIGYFERVLGITESGEHIEAPRGTAGSTGTVLALLKSFVGSGITFMPGAFANGGWVLSSLSLAVIGILNGLCINMLLQCREKTDKSDYGKIALSATGRIGEFLVQASLVSAQFGTCIAFMIFIIKNGVSLGLGTPVSLVGLQLIALIPLCWIRHMEHLEIPNLAADFLIVLGLAAIVIYEVGVFGNGDGALREMQPYKLDTVTLFFGASMQALEGIPTILPIRNAMRYPEHFPRLFTLVFVGIVALYIFFAFLGYACFGAEVQTPVLLNLPAEELWVSGIKGAYMMALLLSVPLMFIPVARITELWCFGVVHHGGKKWGKNSLRTVELIAFAMIAIVGADYFEKFLGLIGGVCATPIAFIYPPLFHLILCADSVATKVLDIAVVAFGIAAMLFVVWQSV